MDIESIDILNIRLSGIIGCIKEYTSEPTIMSVINSLSKALIDNNYDIILFSCKEIEKWYQQNIRAILSNRYVHNYDAHRENITKIGSIAHSLQENEAYYRKAYAEKDIPNSKSYDANVVLFQLIDRFHLVVRQLRDRYNGRDTLDVEDEYDVQDLLHALLQLYYDDIRPEEWTPSSAGTSSRQDFLLKNEKIVIETKKTRKGLGNKELADELIIDIARYATHPDCNSLICFVYDPESRIKNPRGFENDLSKHADGLDVTVYIRP